MVLERVAVFCVQHVFLYCKLSAFWDKLEFAAETAQTTHVLSQWEFAYCQNMFKFI